MKRLLQFSVLLNVALLLAMGWRSARQSPMNRVPRSEVGQPAGKLARRPAQFHAAASRPATPWAAIESADLQRFIANLRALGCPEQTIRDIVALRICRAFRDRLLELEAASMRAWNFTRPSNDHELRESSRQQRELRNEMMYTLESVFGEGWPALSASLLGWPERWRDPMESLSAEQRRELRVLDLRYDELKHELEHKGFTGRLDAEDAAQLRELEQQKQAELATLLSPQELQDYLYRQSPAADYVRKNLPEAKSESEFRAIVNMALEFQMAESPTTMAQRMGVEPGDPAVTKTEAERKAAFDQRLKEVLGEARIAEQQAAEEQRLAEEKKRQDAENERQELARLTEMAAGVGIAEADAKRLFDRLNELRPVLEPKFKEMEKSLTGTDEEKRKQMDAFAKAELGRIAVEIVGEKGAALIEKMAGPGR
jgi:hypothetical protein